MKLVPIFTLSLILFAPTVIAQELDYHPSINGQIVTNSQSLSGILARNISDWPWGVGGSASDLDINQPGYQLEKSNNVLDLKQIQSNGNDWEHTNTGTGASGYSRLPVVQF
jgi:hypothetical protein